MEIIVEKGIPIPKKHNVTVTRRPYTKWDLSPMKIGDSFAFHMKDLRRAVNAAVLYKKNNYGFNYTARQISANQGRIWRIK